MNARPVILIPVLIFLAVSLIVCSGENDNGSAVVPPARPETFLNHNDSVGYAGIQTCRQCHADIYNSYIQTGMGKSFDSASKEKSSALFPGHSVVYDKYRDMYYYPYWKENEYFIREFRLKGKDTVHKLEERVDYIIGSGQHTNSHIYEMNGFFHQMSLTFYTQRKMWDLPPGFESGMNTRFSRKIGLECMSCHNAYPDFVKGSENYMWPGNLPE